MHEEVKGETQNILIMEPSNGSKPSSIQPSGQSGSALAASAHEIPPSIDSKRSATTEQLRQANSARNKPIEPEMIEVKRFDEASPETEDPMVMLNSSGDSVGQLKQNEMPVKQMPKQ